MILRTSADSNLLNKSVRSIIPALTFDLHKGQCGRIGVIGGSVEYTGAPYFAAISALKMGADLAHVFCPRDAATVIKSYSPELIVHPFLNYDTPFFTMQEPMQRMHSFVVGPGLGRQKETASIFRNVITDLTERGIPVVIDADGLYFVAQEPTILRGVKRSVITPNEMEFNRIYKAVLKRDCTPAKETEKAMEETKELCQQLGNVTIVRKGASDLITDGTSVFVCDLANSPRRCGGQGDLLCGSMGTFLHWALTADANGTIEKENGYHPAMIAAYAACLLTKQCNRLAFENLGRSTTTADMIDSIHVAMREFPSDPIVKKKETRDD